MPTPELKPEHVAELERLTREGGRFFVDLGRTLAGPRPSEIRPVCRDVIAPLLARASECWLYAQPANALLESFRPNLRPAGRRYALALDRDVVTGHERFWGADCWQRGAVVWKTPFEPEWIARIFERTYDPGYLLNLRDGTGLGAMSYARTTVQDDPGAVVFLLSANPGLCALHVFAKDHLLELLALALAHTQKAPWYLLNHGRSS